MTRRKAVLLHLGISAAIGAAALMLLFGLWYPPPYFAAAGAERLALLLIGVDVVIGPLLTLIVFKPGKKGLTSDLCVIAGLQLAALAYGLHAMAASRPVFVVAAVDRFELVAANEITDADLAAGKEAGFGERSWSGPRLASVSVPTDAKEYDHVQSLALAGLDLHRLPRYYRDYAANVAALRERARPLDTLLAKNPAARPTVDAWLQAQRRNAADVVWLPLAARRKDIVMLMDKATGQVLDPLDVDAVW
ncbi:TfpX/TfpZ family type IV pilin accessory protein [Tahibacter caeni]|uniref:TfpX/TfpZ family type IV pilin accessory protein n=1 Tax=Tahibacter caeni TaxID=1453545 RepID=UPI002148B721|nr:TfpX/TfpZ family type IV pilin accessory protein [Tahibacter caeni]